VRTLHRWIGGETALAERRIALTALGGLLLALRTAAPDSLNGSLLIGWALTLSGLAIVLVGLRQNLVVPVAAGRLLVAAVAALGLAGGAIAATQAVAALTGPTAQIACRDDVALVSSAGGRLLREGHNPYTSYDAMKELQRCGSAQVGTVLAQGRFAGRTLMPTQSEIDQASHDARADPTRPEFERRLDYPGGSVLAGIAGVRGLLALVVLSLAVALVTVVRRVSPPLRAVTLLALLAQTAAWTALDNGHADGIAIGLLVITWAMPTTAAGGLALGLACGVKQTAWFFVPALLVTAHVRGGFRSTVRVAGAGAAGFLLLNAGFIVAGPSAWLDGILAPARDGLFPLGAGAIGLVTSGLVTSAAVPVFTVLMAAVTAGAALVAWRFDRRLPGVGAVVAVMALWVGPRSLLEYMAGAGLLSVTVCALGIREAGAETQAGHALERVA